MPDSRRHRGPHPQDADLFAPTEHAKLRQAAGHLAWLLSRGYASASSLKLVGDRFALLERQRRAVMRSSCSADSLRLRRQRQVALEELSGSRVTIDGFNLLTTVEAALSGGVLLLGQDGCLRDMASMHGSYRRVEETRPALEHIGSFCQRHGVASCRWWLDQPVSNSGRLQTLMRELAAERGWDWEVELMPDPDTPLRETGEIVVSADAAVLDDCRRWVNLAAAVVAERDYSAVVVDFRDSTE